MIVTYWIGCNVIFKFCKLKFLVFTGKMVLGLEIGRDIVPEVGTNLAQDDTPVRQSRRIAQLKIKEQADRRRIEEETMRELEDKKESEKKKRKKQKVSSYIKYKYVRIQL